MKYVVIPTIDKKYYLCQKTEQSNQESSNILHGETEIIKRYDTSDEIDCSHL